MADVVAMASGFLFAAAAPVWLSVVLLVGTELWMLWMIRDNLTLNIINLIRPNEKLIQWQPRGGLPPCGGRAFIPPIPPRPRRRPPTQVSARARRVAWPGRRLMCFCQRIHEAR